MTDPRLIRIDGSDRIFSRGKILFVLLLPLAMSLMAVSSVNVALHTIEAGLGATASDVQWILSGYALAFGISLIPSGRMGDLLGRGSWFIIGLALFVAASLACGGAPTPLFLNAARIVQGLGAGIFSPQVTGMIQQYFTGQARARAFALFGLVISVSIAVGPILAGAIIQAVGAASGWRWAFWANIPLGLLGLVLAFVWFPFENERERLRRRRAGEPRDRIDLDVVGTTLLALAVVCVMYPFMARQPWVWLLLPGAALLLWAWSRWERHFAASGREPMVDMRLFGFRSFRNGMAVSGTMFLGITSMFVVVALYLQSGLGLGALATGLVGLPNALLSGYASMWAARHVLTIGRRLIIGALALMVASTVASMLAVVGIAAFGWPWWLLAITLSAQGFAMGAFQSSNQTLSLTDVPVRSGGTAGGIKQTVERIGTALGNAIVTGVLFAVQPGAGWTWAFVAAYAVITAFLIAALALGILDERQHRRPPQARHP